MDLLTAFLLLLPPLLHGAVTLAAERGDRETAWWRAEAAALASTAAGLAAVVLLALDGTRAAHGLRLDAAGALVMLLVGFVGWALLRFARRYLLGEPGDRRGLRLLSGTLAAVSLVLVADHLLLLVLAWSATSVTLHRLLRFYDERPAARLAAHKKFVSARIADALLLAAAALLGLAYDTLSLQAMLDAAAQQGVPPLAQAGLLLLVLATLLKCAQMPLHGWLIQVMEAPTPVSALLHAGVVNLGGLVLIRFSPLLAQAPAALVLLAAVATVTVVLATLVAGTRVSVKVALAWSTVAQMGFMLLEVALGLPAIALLHLLAHSLYKAHAFLAAGGVVQRRQVLRLAPNRAPVAWQWVLAALAGPALVLGAGIAVGALVSPAAWLAGAVLGLALVPLLAGGRLVVAGTAALAWFAAHAAASAWPVPAAFAVPPALVALVALALAAMFVLQGLIVLAPGSRFVRALYPWAYGGFYVDEATSRLLLARWPLAGAAPLHPVAGAR